jgi:hypothetical protein
MEIKILILKVLRCRVVILYYFYVIGELKSLILLISRMQIYVWTPREKFFQTPESEIM